MTTKPTVNTMEIVKIKNKEGGFLTTQQIVKTIENIKSQFNSESRTIFLNYKIEKSNVFLSVDDLFILKAKLSHFGYSLDHQSP